jgi:phosphate/sulfate permease
VGQIMLCWIITVPCGAAFAALAYALLAVVSR